MGLFSFLNKNKQESTDRGYHSRDDDDDAAVGARARAKRASNAGEPAAKRAAADPVLPEKKRARRRLVGAIALALAVAVGLPMVLDAEPKPLATDIDFRIPARDKAGPQRVPVPVAAAESLDRREEIVAPPKVAPVPVAPVVPAPRDVAEVKVASVKPELKKPEPKAPEKAPEKAATPAPKADAARALAILEDKPATAPSSQKYIVQVAALASQEKVNELQGKLKAAGIPSFTQKGSGKSGELIRVRVGPFSKDEGETIRAKLGKLGLSGAVVPNS
ncbi:MAG: SPOR domain-containing protein [Pseudomonadota bacterium]